MNSICAEVEMNKLSLLRPTLLLRYDYLTIDKQDYEEIMGSDKNGWHKLLKSNLSFLYDIDAVRISDFQDYLSKNEKERIRQKGHEIVKKIENEEKRKLLIKTWKDYINYIEIKAFHLQGNEKDYRRQIVFLNKLRNHYQSIIDRNWASETQDYILESCFWKTIASSILSNKTKNTALHLADEYSPFVDYIKPISGNERITQIDNLIKHIYSLSLPSVSISNFTEQKAFIELRKNKLRDYINLCEQLDEILSSFDNSENPFEETKNYLTDRWSYGFHTINGFFTKMKNVALLPEYLVQVIFKTFKYFFPLMPDVPIPSDQIKEASKRINPKPLTALKHSSEDWQVAFCTVFNEREIKRIKKGLRKEHSSTYDGKLNNWIENIGNLPWYVE